MDRYGYSVKTETGLRRPILFYVDSRDESTKTEYTVDVGGSYRDVISIELVKAIIPNPDSDDYVIISLDIANDSVGNTTELSSAFCTVELNSPGDSKFIYKRGNCAHNIAYIKYFDSPKLIRNMKITFKRPNGSVPDYGILNHLLVFEINTLNQPKLPW